MIDLAKSSNPHVRALLEKHPRVADVEDGGGEGVSFRVGGWQRAVRVNNPDVEISGLMEMMDNNPVVCADEVSVPEPVATLALIALGPLASASIISDSPTIIANVKEDEETLDRFLATSGWTGGVAVHTEAVDLEGVIAVTVMVAIDTPEDLDDIDELYEERFGRSFYVRRDEESTWAPELVRGTPKAVYRVRISPDQPQSLLSIRVLADVNGKVGAAQIVHAMNVMCGFEESLGI